MKNWQNHRKTLISSTVGKRSSKHLMSENRGGGGGGGTKECVRMLSILNRQGCR